MTDLPTVHLGLQLEVGTFQREHYAGCTATRCLRTYSSRDVDEEKKKTFLNLQSQNVSALQNTLSPGVLMRGTPIQNWRKSLRTTPATIYYTHICKHNLLGEKHKTALTAEMFCCLLHCSERSSAVELEILSSVEFPFFLFFCYDPWKHASMIKYFSPDVFGKLLPVSGKHYSLICTLGQLVIMLHDILSR